MFQCTNLYKHCAAFQINTRDLGRQVNRILIAQKQKFPTKSESGTSSSQFQLTCELRLLKTTSLVAVSYLAV
jgi:hypothetical protein